MTYNHYEVVFGKHVPYFARIKNGKVESYGKMGDFDYSENPTMDINLDSKIT